MAGRGGICSAKLGGLVSSPCAQGTCCLLTRSLGLQLKAPVMSPHPESPGLGWEMQPTEWGERIHQPRPGHGLGRTPGAHTWVWDRRAPRPAPVRTPRSNGPPPACRRTAGGEARPGRLPASPRNADQPLSAGSAGGPTGRLLKGQLSSSGDTRVLPALRGGGGEGGAEGRAHRCRPHHTHAHTSDSVPPPLPQLLRV